MPLGPYADWAECHGAQMRKGHTSAEADRICGALEQKAAGSELVTSQLPEGQNEDSNNLSAEEEKPKGDVSFNEGEINDITQGLTDAKAFLATVEAPPELIDSINKAFDVVYSKVDAGPAEEQAPPFA
jgi:hypothetical protein